MTVPSGVMPVTRRNVVGRAIVRRDSVTVAVFVPAEVEPVKETSAPVKPVTDSLKTTVKLIGEVFVGSF